MTVISQAYVSGSLGQALFVERGRSMVLDVRKLNTPRISTGNDVSFFFNTALEVVPIEDHGGSILINDIAIRLIEETRRFDAVDGLLVGMDSDHEEADRRRFIARSERSMNSDPVIERFVRRRVLVPTDREKWDIAGAQSLARSISATTAALLYDILSSGIIDRLADDAHTIVREIIGRAAQAAHVEDVVLKSGLLGEIAIAEISDRKDDIANLLFRQDDFSDLKIVDHNGHILTKLIARYSRKPTDKLGRHKVGARANRATEPLEVDGLTPSQRRTIHSFKLPIRKKKLSKKERDGTSLSDAESSAERPRVSDPIIDAIEHFTDRQTKYQQDGLHRLTTEETPESIDNEIKWIEERLDECDADAGEAALIKLIEYQSDRSRREHLVKSLTRIADKARRAGLIDFSIRVFDACSLLGGQDAIAFSAQAELLRDLGRPEDALAALDETIRMFPNEVVPRNARAEVLRELDRSEEALAAFDESIRLFPLDVVARSARAEVLRELDRSEEALAALNETIRIFPHEVVPRGSRAEVLRELARPEDALAALDETIRLFPNDVVSRSARAEVLRELERPKDALAAFDEAIEMFPRDVVSHVARAEVLRELERPEDALAALDETIRIFPYNEVARTARANLLSLLGRHTEVVESLGGVVDAPRTRDDWINVHVLAISTLRAGLIEDAIVMLENGRANNPFRDTRSYFDGALAVALLAKRNATEAVTVLDQAEQTAGTAEQRKTLYLLRTHAIVDIGKPEVALDLLRKSATIIPFESFLQKRLARELTLRIQITSGRTEIVGLDLRENDSEVLKLETLLVTSFAPTSRRSIRLVA
jgi:tetratricopeptide (TPR) repeat protein